MPSTPINMGTATGAAAVTAPNGTTGLPAASGYTVAAVDYDGVALAGNDTTGAFGTGATMAAALAAAVLTPFKTLDLVGQLVPGFGNGGTLVVLIKPRIAGATYKKIDGVTDTDMTWMNSLTGWLRVVVRATTDFSNSAADKILCGFQIAGATNVAGYNATTATTTNLSVCQLAGGGAPGFPAEASGISAISVKRIRFDAATVTVALRNATQMILSNTTTGLILGSALPAAPAAGDVFYIEEPGVRVGSFAFTCGGNQAVTIAGVRSTTASFAILQAPGSVLNCAGLETGGQVVFQQMLANVITRTYPDEASAAIAVGVGIRTDGILSAATIDGPLTWNFFGNLGSGQTNVGLRVIGYNIGATAALCATGIVLPNSAAYVAAAPTLISPLNAVGGPNLRIVQTPGGSASAIDVLAGNCVSIKGADISNQTKALVRIAGVVNGGITIDGLTSSAGGNTDVVVDCSATTYDTVIVVGQTTANTASAAIGDLRLAGGVIAPFAALATTNFIDSRGNNISGAADRVVSRGVNYTNSSGGAIAQYSVVRSNGTTGQMTTAQADTAPHAAGILGVCITAPANGALGLVVPVGGQTWVQFDASTPTAGGIAYLSTGTAGDVQSGIPTVAATNQKNRLGIVGKVSGTLGLIGVNPDKLSVAADGLA